MSTMPRLIGLGGKLRSGKDALGDYLEEHHGYTKMGMSDALNEALLLLNPIIVTHPIPVRYQDLHNAVGYVEAKKNPEVRRLLQILGTEVGREMIDPDVWVDIAEKKIRSLWAEGKSVVITAMRFPNEIDMLDRLGGVSVWIDRPARSRFEGLEYDGEPVTPKNALKAVGAAYSASEGHASENSVNADMFGYTISNNGTLEDLYSRAEEILPGAVASSWSRAEMHFAPPYDR